MEKLCLLKEYRAINTKHQESVVEIVSHVLFHVISLSLILPFILLNWKIVSSYSMPRSIWITNPMKNAPSPLISCLLLARVFCRPDCISIGWFPLITEKGQRLECTLVPAAVPALTVFSQLWNTAWFCLIRDAVFVFCFVFSRNWQMEHLKSIVNSAFPKGYIFHSLSVLLHVPSLHQSSLNYRNPKHCSMWQLFKKDLHIVLT